MRMRTGHPLLGKVVRWTHGLNVLVGPATVYDDSDDELFIVPDGLMHGHYWVPAGECVEVKDSAAREEAERRWPRGWNVEEGTWRDGAVNGFVLGAEWARQLASSEVERVQSDAGWELFADRQGGA